MGTEDNEKAMAKKKEQNKTNKPQLSFIKRKRSVFRANRTLNVPCSWDLTFVVCCDLHITQNLERTPWPRFLKSVYPSLHHLWISLICVQLISGIKSQPSLHTDSAWLTKYTLFSYRVTQGNFLYIQIAKGKCNCTFNKLLLRVAFQEPAKLSTPFAMTSCPIQSNNSGFWLQS